MLSFIGTVRLPLEVGPVDPTVRSRGADPAPAGDSMRSRVRVVGSNRRGCHAGLSVRDAAIARWNGLVC